MTLLLADPRGEPRGPRRKSVGSRPDGPYDIFAFPLVFLVQC